MTAFGGPENLVLENRPVPEVGPGQVLIGIEAAGVGHIDILAMTGQYPFVSNPGFTPGFEVAGTVEAIGTGVDQAWVGRRVFAMLGTGGFAEKAVVEADKLIRVPDAVSSAQAVAVGINGLVASLGLDRVTNIAGRRVLVRGAGGGIGLMAVQLGALRGGIVTAVTSSDERCERLKILGASHVLNRNSVEPEDVSAEYDVIVDTVAGPAIGGFVGMLANNGQYLLCGAASGIPPTDFGMGLLVNYHKSPSLLAFSLNSVGADQYRAAAEALLGQVVTGRLIPVIEEIMALEKAVDALHRIIDGKIFGKLVLHVIA